jgi:2-C-methyl-D-erythritol 2,4-cyclodiphosphate synthase
MIFRTGFGHDIHRLQDGKELVIGGIRIPHYKSAMGHSDADVLIHAICDALLGAANLRDIGFHFPDSSPEWKGSDSRILLQKVHALLKEKGYRIVNIDSTIGLEKPRLLHYIPLMQAELALLLETAPENISIKAKTGEGLGFVGKEEAIEAFATVLIQKNGR